MRLVRANTASPYYDGLAEILTRAFGVPAVRQGHDWYHKATASPDSLADHPAVTGARHPLTDNPLFYEEVNYAASRAFERLSGDEHAFWDALAARGPRDLLITGEDFDFDDDQEMRRRLPQLSACCLGSSPGNEQS